jgi:DNA polymerase-1
MKIKKKLIVIDLSNFIFRAFFAIRPLHTATGVPVNAVYGVLNMLLKMMEDVDPSHICIAQDSKEESFRDKIYEGYKANRDEAPDDLIPQFQIIDDLIDLLKIKRVRLPGFEADDIIGSIVTQLYKDFDDIFIASGDKDLMQFVNDKVVILDTMKDKILQRGDVFEKMGVYPEQIVDYLSIVGDTSDNIPGVKGLGAKGAAKLLAAHGSLENIYANLESVANDRSRALLTEQREIAFLSKQLVSIRCDLDIIGDAHEYEYSYTHDQKIVDFLLQLGFKSILKKLPVSVDLGSATGASSQPVVKSALAPELTPAAVDAESIALFLSGSRLSMFDGKEVTDLDLSEKTAQVLKGSKKSIAVWDAKVMSKAFLQKKISIDGIDFFDVCLADFNLNAHLQHTPEVLVERYLQGQLPKEISLDLSETDFNLYHLKSLLSLGHLLKQKLVEFKVDHIFFNLDMPMVTVLSKMEIQGICLDTHYLKTLSTEYTQVLENIENEIVAVSGEKVNLNSPKQVSFLLFEKLGLPILKKTKTGASTDASVLEKLAQMDLHPIPKMMMDYREVDKLLSTYVSALPKLIDSHDDKIHTRYNLMGAATGRLSSDQPNLQNIPIRSERGRRLRKAFTASPGKILLSADYSQIELRILAHCSQDPKMMDAFKNNVDIHVQTAAQIFSIGIDKVTDDQRSKAKAINFGLMYGQSSFGLSEALNIPQKEAKEYITYYFQQFSHVKGFLDSLKENCEKTGYAETMLGRKRIIPEIKSSNRTIKSVGERMAINSPIQGTAADLIKKAMIAIDKIIIEEKISAKMLLQVHDELIFEVDPSELHAFAKIVRREMETAMTMSVPLKVDTQSGKDWFEMKDLD